MWQMRDLYVIVHVFCDYNLAIILISVALELWLIQHYVNSFLLHNGCYAYTGN